MIGIPDLIFTTTLEKKSWDIVAKVVRMWFFPYLNANMMIFPSFFWLIWKWIRWKKDLFSIF